MQVVLVTLLFFHLFYKHVFPPQLAPTLSFIGIPNRVSFNIVLLQANWVAGVLSGKVTLPSIDKMLADVEKHYQFLDEIGIHKSQTHSLLLRHGKSWVELFPIG
ncbi:unnamed protein product [Coffea canephora]|uniref:Flavin-containing monooxygenase n=1 Tax=Coffea canephora TaxID=49390 RepID=A0A068VFZ3_COFCA|nr:unnamed protein product [Coffea canephora]